MHRWILRCSRSRSCSANDFEQPDHTDAALTLQITQESTSIKVVISNATRDGGTYPSCQQDAGLHMYILKELAGLTRLFLLLTIT